MAENGQDDPDELRNAAGSRPLSAKDDKQVRIRNLKERQNEERQRKLEEIKAQALNAQKFKQQMENERRQRLEELKMKEDLRRQQAEQRRRAILDAERDRLESILKRNQEREVRVESKRRNESSSLVFAFGSSIPRTLDPTDSTGSFWGHRRATSTQNIPSSTVQLGRKQSERDLNGATKKRAISVSGLERSPEDMHLSTSMYEIFRWDGSQPPIPSPAQAITRSTSSHFGTSPQVPAGCASGYVGRRRTDLMPTIPLRESSSPATGTRKTVMRSPASSRPGSSMSQQSTSSGTSGVTMRHRLHLAPAHPRPISIAGTGISSDFKKDNKTTADTKPPLPKTKKNNVAGSKEKLKKKSPTTEEAPVVKDESPVCVISQEPEPVKSSDNVVSVKAEEVKVEESVAETTEVDLLEGVTDMTASAKIRITTEEEAKAALAERRRVAREEAEKQAELERQRIEEEARLELERQQREEEQQRMLIEQLRAAEQKRLEEAIREAKQKEEEERLRREEEQRLKVLKEEAEQKAREEAERQKAELQERLLNEEKEREARRKRVEAIMLRTRAKSASNTNSQNGEENLKTDKINGSKPSAPENGHRNAKDAQKVDNIIPVDSITNANTVTVDTLGTEDTLNSNNTWQHNTRL